MRSTSNSMKRYDSMGFESEHGIWVRAVDADERIRELEAAIEEIWKAPRLSEVKIIILRLRGKIPYESDADSRT